MKTKRIQLLMMGALAFFASCGGGGDDGGEESGEDSTIVVEDPDGVNPTYSAQSCDISTYYEARHAMFEGKNDGAYTGLISVMLTNKEKILSVLEKDTINKNGDKVLLYQITIGDDNNFDYPRLASWDQSLNRTLFDSAKFLTIHLVKNNKVLDRTVYELNVNSPNPSGNRSDSLSLVSTTVVPKSCHGFEVNSNYVLADMVDECTFKDDTTKKGHNKIGFFVKDKAVVEYNGAYVERDASGRDFVIFDFNIKDDGNAGAEGLTIFDISIQRGTWTGEPALVLQYTTNGSGKKKKVLTSTTQGNPITKDCHQ